MESGEVVPMISHDKGALGLAPEILDTWDYQIFSPMESYNYLLTGTQQDGSLTPPDCDAEAIALVPTVDDHGAPWTSILWRYL